MSYDRNNVYARILRGELPSKRVLETKHSLVFEDIRPQAEVHLLAIPKGEYTSWDDFSENAGDDEIADLVRAAGEAARRTGVAAGGFRVISNCGPDSHQEIPHLHLHVIGGEDLGRMISVPSRRRPGSG